MGKRRVASRDAVLGAAVRLFEQKGFQQTSMDDVAHSLGIAKPTVYQYVSTKGALLEGIAESLLNRLKADLDRAAGIEDAEQQFHEMLRLFVSAVHDLQPYFLIFFGEERELPPRTRKRFRAWAREMTDEVAVILDRGRRDGLLREDVDPRIGAFLLIGMLTSIARWYDPGGRLSTDDIADQVRRILEGYVRPRRRGAVQPVAKDSSRSAKTK